MEEIRNNHTREWNRECMRDKENDSNNSSLLSINMEPSMHARHCMYVCVCMHAHIHTHVCSSFDILITVLRSVIIPIL